MSEKKRQRVVLAIGTIMLFSVLTTGISAAGKTTLKVWILPWWEKFGPYTAECLKAFEQQNPTINLEVQTVPWKGVMEKFQAAIASGTNPDVSATTANRFIPISHALEPLDKYIDKEFESKFGSFTLEMTKYKGHYYNVPTLAEVRVLFYNEDMYESAGIPDPPSNWTEFREIAQKITRDIDGDGKIDQYGYGFAGIQRSFARFTFWLTQSGGDVFNEEGTRCIIDNKAGLRALRFVVDLLRKYKVMSMSTVGMNEEEIGSLFAGKKIGITIEGANFMPGLDKIGLSYGLSLVMEGPAGKRITYGGPELYMMFRNTKYKTESWKLLEFMSTDKEFIRKRCERFNYLPVIRDSGVEFKDPRMNIFLKQAEMGYKDVVGHPKMTEVTEVLVSAIQQALTGKKTPEDAFNEAVQYINNNILR